MFNSKTVFVLGAGASAEADVPVGNELTSEIAGLTNFYVEHFDDLKTGDAQIYHVLKGLASSDVDKWGDNRFIASGREISEAMGLAPSIDTFLETHATNDEYVLIGKLGIAKAILSAERNSKFAPTSDGTKPFSMSSITDTWYRSLGQQLFSGVPSNAPASAFDNVSFIVFNYDRCLEVFLLKAIQVYFRVTQDAALEILSNVNIVHPYGSLGSLQSRIEGFVPFGSERYSLHDVSKRIQTFSESVDDGHILENVRSQIADAETLVFLGFAFHDQNLRLLDDGKAKVDKKSNIQNVFATTYGLSDSDTKVVRSQIEYMLKGRPMGTRDQYSIDTLNGSCSKLFAEYWRSLTA